MVARKRRACNLKCEHFTVSRGSNNGLLDIWGRRGAPKDVLDKSPLGGLVKKKPRTKNLSEDLVKRTYWTKNVVGCCLKGFGVAHAQNPRKVLLKGLRGGARSKPSWGAA